jgi:hypothetical protein
MFMFAITVCANGVKKETYSRRRQTELLFVHRERQQTLRSNMIMYLPMLHCRMCQLYRQTLNSQVPKLFHLPLPLSRFYN